MLLPSIRTETYRRATCVKARFRRAPIQPGVRSIPIIVMLEIKKLRLQIARGPEERLVEIFSPYRADHPFYERMGQGEHILF
jgi:hypothetical protein